MDKGCLIPSTLPFSHKPSVRREGFNCQHIEKSFSLDLLLVVWEKDLG